MNNVLKNIVLIFDWQLDSSFAREVNSTAKRGGVHMNVVKQADRKPDRETKTKQTITCQNFILRSSQWMNGRFSPECF